MRTPVDFTFGGQKYSATVTIGHAVAIEAALGRGAMSLVAPLAAFEARLTDALSVIGCALKAEGYNYSADKLAEMAAVEGIVATQVTALCIVNALFIPTKDAKGKTKSKGKADAGPLATDTPLQIA